MSAAATTRLSHGRRATAPTGAAVQLYVDGMNLRRSGRTLGVVHQTVANWVAAHADALPVQPPQPDTPVEVAELDELYTFVGEQKTSPTS